MRRVAPEKGATGANRFLYGGKITQSPTPSLQAPGALLPDQVGGQIGDRTVAVVLKAAVRRRGPDVVAAGLGRGRPHGL